MRIDRPEELSLRLKISAILVLVGLLLLLNVGGVWLFLDQQNHDGAIIDQAGRQRMLVQEMVIQAHYIAMGNDGYRHHLAATADEYNSSLNSLLSGDESTDVPPPPPHVKRELLEAKSEWQPFHRRVRTIVDKPREDEEFQKSINYLRTNDQVLLAKTDDTVQAFQIAYERKVSRLRWVLSLLAGLDIIALGVLYVLTDRRIIRPIDNLATVAEEISTGEHDREIPQLDTRDEVGTLTRSVASMKEQLVDSLRRARGFERAVEHAGAAIYITDTDGTIQYVNPSFEQQTGYSQKEAIGSNPRILKSGEHPPSFYQTLWETITAGEVWEGEITNSRRDGERYQIEQTIAPIEVDGKIDRFVAVNHDITDLKKLEAELRQERDQFAALFENISEPVVEVEFVQETPVVRDINPAFTNVFGIDRETIMGESLDDHIIPDGRNEEATELNHLCIDEGRIERTVERKTASGTRTFLLRTASTSVNGRPHCFGIYLDITDRIERSRQLQRQNERLEDFASVVSHDLRNPLNVAAGGIELVLDEYESEHLERSYSALERMETMIEDLLELARTGSPIEEAQPVDLATIASEAWTMTDTVDIDTSIEIADDLGSPLGDRNRCLRLFENLYRNAIEHASTGDGVAVTVAPLADGEGFYVADDGPGIPPSDRDRVLEPGYSTARDGTGFGLKIVKEIAEAHGWELTVSESLDGGARFEFSIPTGSNPSLTLDSVAPTTDETPRRESP